MVSPRGFTDTDTTGRLSPEANPSTSAEKRVEAAAEVSPGDGVFNPPVGKQESRDKREIPAVGEGFGPPPAFPSSNGSLGKRKRTIVTVSTGVNSGASPAEEDSSEEESPAGKQQSQQIHRTKDAPAINERTATGKDGSKRNTYNDAMLLASLSEDLGSPKIKAEEACAVAPTDPAQQTQEGTASPTNSGTSSTDNTPLRSNVNPNTAEVESTESYPLLLKPASGDMTSTSKRAKVEEQHGSPVSPDRDDVVAAKATNDEGGQYAYPPSYPPHGPPGYGYHYPPNYPPHPMYGYSPHGPPGMPPSYYQPRPQVGSPSRSHGQAPPQQLGPVSPEVWGQYHSPKPHAGVKAEPVPSNTPEGQPPYHPSSPDKRNIVPTSSEESHQSGRSTASAASRVYGVPPPPPGYGPPPPRDVYPHPAYSAEHKFAGNEGSPGRSGVVDSTPPRGYQVGPPHHGAYAPHGFSDTSPSYMTPRENFYDQPFWDHSSQQHEGYTYPTTAHQHTPHAPPPSSQFRKGGRSIHSEPVVLRKKFSWRNYPELEEYLIANRDEYLRHSALNYTAEQKHFNNRLTEGLLELAAKLNYVFDECCFNFVAVRDRIRCYYKSYVQSSKKRGVIVNTFPKAKREKN